MKALVDGSADRAGSNAHLFPCGAPCRRSRENVRSCRKECPVGWPL